VPKKKLTLSEIAADRAVVKAIAELPGYQSVNPAYGLEAILQMDATLEVAQQASARSRKANEQDRIVEQDTAQMLHEIVTVAKAQVFAQYGPDAYAVKAIGWTRKSDRKRPVRKAAAD
jgi:hypothetical protein